MVEYYFRNRIVLVATGSINLLVLGNILLKCFFCSLHGFDN